MTATDALLVFLDANDAFEGWLRLRDGVVAERGTALEGLPPPGDGKAGDPLRIVAVVPGEAVSVHWLEVPAGLAPLQAIAAARLIASEVSAQPLADMHVAVGAETEGGTLRPVAVVPALAMARWIGRLQERGLDPDILLPEPLLLCPPEQGLVRYQRSGVPLYRGTTDAFSAEPELADIVTGGADIETVDTAGYEAGVADALAQAPLNLRQGAFAKRRRWKIEWPLVRRLASLAAAILVATLAIQIVAILRYTYAADALEAEAQRVAAAALPGTAISGDSRARLDQRLSDLRGGGIGYDPLAAALFGAIQATPNVALTAMRFGRDGNLRATVQADTPAAISALQQRIEAGGLVASADSMRSGGGRPTADLTVRGR